MPACEWTSISSLSAAQWVSVVGLVVSIFSAGLAFFGDGPLRSGKRAARDGKNQSHHRTRWWSTGVAACAGVVALTAFSFEQVSICDTSKTVEQEAAKLINDGSRYFWTFDDLLERIQANHRDWSVAVAPLVQTALTHLVQQEIVTRHILSWPYGSPPDNHEVTIYCHDCRPPDGLR